MSVVLKVLTTMGAKLLTAAVIEKVVVWLAEELVKRTASKADDKLLAIIKEGLDK